MYQDAVNTIATVVARYPMASPAFPLFEREDPAQALLSALKRMSVSHDNIAACSTALGVSLNPSTMTRIGSDERRPTQRVLVGLCLVWALAVEMMERRGEDVAEARVLEMARAVFLQAMEAEWETLVRG